MSRMFRKEIEKGLALMCEKIGFKRNKYSFIKKIDDEVYATLSFGFVSYQLKGHIYVDVSVGVSHTKLNDLHSRLSGYSNNNRLISPTLHQQIGYLMPEDEYKEWDFVENMDNSKVYEDLLQCIQTYGFPYQQKLKQFDNIFEAYEKRFSGVLNIHRDKYLPIFYYLKGEKEKGLKVIEEAIERESKPLSKEEIDRFSSSVGPNGEVFIRGPVGVDASYLEFVERYKSLK